MEWVRATFVDGGDRTVDGVRRCTRALGAWAALMTLAIVWEAAKGDSAFFRVGPHPDLVIMGMRIDTAAKYAVVVIYCFVNSIARSVHHAVVNSWVTNNVQDVTRSPGLRGRTAAVYEIVAVSTVYTWLDWVMYIFILLSQADFVCIEVVAELLVSFVTTRAYLSVPERDPRSFEREGEGIREPLFVGS